MSEPVSYRLGAKLRALRAQRGLSVRTFATQVGFSPSFISQLESDLVSPSIASLEKIAGALGVTLGQLFSSLERTTEARMIVRHRGRLIYTSSWSNSTVAVLADPAPERSISAMELELAPGGMSGRHPEARPHDTLAILLRGNLVLILEASEELLEPGDTVYLSAGTPCAWVNRSAEPAVLHLIGTTSRADLVREVVALPQASDASAAP